jgi:predicted kinase
MARLFALCGLSFSGKTTLARAISAAIGADYISLDDINEERGLRGGEGISGEEWNQTSLIAVERSRDALERGRDVVLDDTLSFRWLRDRYAEAARQRAAQFILIYVSIPLAEIHAARARNDVSRQRKPIREDVFDDHARRFEVPAADEAPLIYDRALPIQEWLARYVSDRD